MADRLEARTSPFIRGESSADGTRVKRRIVLVHGIRNH